MSTGCRSRAEEIVYGEAGYRGIYKWPSIEGAAADFRVEMYPNMCKIRMITSAGRLLGAVRDRQGSYHVIKSIRIQEKFSGFEPEIKAKVACKRCRKYQVGIFILRA